MENQPPSKKLTESVLTRIATDAVAPTGRWVFTSREYALWLAWVATLLIGAIAVAVTLFVTTYRQYSLFFLTHDSWADLLFDVLPLLWLFVLVVMVYLALYNIRHTKHGYRYDFFWLIGSSVLGSVLVGVVLHLFGTGFIIDTELGSQMQMYISQEKQEMASWQNPRTGRLVGMGMDMNFVGSPTQDAIAGAEDWSIVSDIDGVRWVTDISELTDIDIAYLESHKKVRILGMMITQQPPRFYACVVFPWMYEYEYSRGEINALETSARERVARHLRIQRDFQKGIGAAEPTKCADMMLVKKLDSAF